MAVYKYLSVEVPLLLLSFSMMLQGSIVTNLFMYRTCYTVLGYDENDCSQLGNYHNNVTEELEPKVQPTVNYINMVHSVISATFPVFFCMYVGTWSDKFGRKPFLIFTMTGVVLNTVSTTIVIHYKYASSWWFIASTFPSLLSGGFAAQFIVTSAYLIDVSTKDDRVVRLAVIEFIFSASSFVGNLTSSRLLYATSYEAVFMISTVLQFISILYTIFFIPESVKAEKKLDRIPKLKDLWDNINFADVIRGALRKRENNINVYLYSVIGVQLFASFAAGEMHVASLYLRAKLHWTLTHLNLVGSITSVGNIFGTMLGTFIFYKLLKIKELPLALLAVTLSIVTSFLRAIATSDMYIYIAHALGIFGGMTMLMWKTIMSYMLSPDEMGKIFALMSILQSFIGTISSLVYPAIYNATLNNNSGVYNYLSMGVHCIVAIAIIVLSRLNIPHHETPPNEPTKEDKENEPKLSISVQKF